MNKNKDYSSLNAAYKKRVKEWEKIDEEWDKDEKSKEMKKRIFK